MLPLSTCICVAEPFGNEGSGSQITGLRNLLSFVESSSCKLLPAKRDAGLGKAS